MWMFKNPTLSSALFLAYSLHALVSSAQNACGPKAQLRLNTEALLYTAGCLMGRVCFTPLSWGDPLFLSRGVGGALQFSHPWGVAHSHSAMSTAL